MGDRRWFAEPGIADTYVRIPSEMIRRGKSSLMEFEFQPPIRARDLAHAFHELCDRAGDGASVTDVWLNQDTGYMVLGYNEETPG